MKQQIKSISKLTTILLFFMFCNCQKEDLAINLQSKTTKDIISLSQFKNETKIKVFQKTFKLPVSETTSKNNLVPSDFYIETETIQKYISTNSKTTYSFVIYPVSENKIPNQTFNLVYHKENDVWEQSVFLLTKKIVTNYNQNIYESIENVYNTNTTSTHSSDKIGEMCISETFTLHCTNTGSCFRTGICDLCSYCVTRTVSIVSCPSTGGGASNGTDTGSNDPNYSGGGSNSNPYEFTPNMFENPVYNDPNYINACKAEYFFNYLQDFEKTWANQNVTTYNEIINYLIQNQWSLDSKNFANETIVRMAQNPTIFKSLKPFLIEKNIDDSGLDPCSKNVFQQIKNTTNCDFTNILAKLDANETIYNTTIKTDHNNIVVSGQLKEVTDPANTTRNTLGVKYNYTVYVNPDYQGKTKLYIATLLLHEIAHTYFFSLVDDYNMGATNSFNELPILFNAVVISHFPIGPDLHHEEMANSYVNVIASALKEYKPGLPQQIYDDLAWSGLEKTNIFNTLFPIGSNTRQRILNRKAAEQSGRSVGQGTTNVQNPMGQQCN